MFFANRNENRINNVPSVSFLLADSITKEEVLRRLSHNKEWKPGNGYDNRILGRKSVTFMQPLTTFGRGDRNSDSTCTILSSQV